MVKQQQVGYQLKVGDRELREDQIRLAVERQELAEERGQVRMVLVAEQVEVRMILVAEQEEVVIL